MTSHSYSIRSVALAVLLSVVACQEVLLTDGIETEKTIAGVPVRSYSMAYKGLTSSAAVVKVMGSDFMSVVDAKESWIAVFKKGCSKDHVDAACNTAGEQCIQKRGGSFFSYVAVRDVTEVTLASMVGAAPCIDFFEPDFIQTIPELPTLVGTGRSVAAPSSNPWHFDTIAVAQRPGTGAGVHVFILDTGINTNHAEFNGRAIPWSDPSDGKNVCGNSNGCAFDNHGHGTHVAGSVAGETTGVAPAARLYAVKVLSDQGSGATSWILAGMSNVAEATTLRPATMTMSLGGPRSGDSYRLAIDELNDAGVSVVVAAGNEFQDACNFGPAYVPNAITVGATDSDDVRATFSNWGSCVDIFAPGVDISSADASGGLVEMSGTSMACPVAAGGVAILLGINPALTPAEVVDTLVANAAENVVERLSDQAPYNKRLYVGSDAPPPAQSNRTQIDWPTDAFFSSCRDRDTSGWNSGPLENYGMANCACQAGICFNGAIRGCPISPELERLQEFNPGLVLKEMFWQWQCEKCNCIDEDFAPRSGPALLVAAAMFMFGLGSLQAN